MLRGSISSFETYFQCPYAYFLKSGLRLSKGSLTTVNAAIVGTIQHALLEQSIQTWGKDYAKLNETEMLSLIHILYSAFSGRRLISSSSGSFSCVRK